MRSTNWNAARASTWLKRFADEVGSDAYEMGGDACLYEAVGAAFYATIHGVGYSTRKEFIDFCRTHMGVADGFIEEALAEIDSDKAI